MISKNLQLTILAIDSYNRGYGGAVTDGNNLDAAGNDLDGLGGQGSQIAGAAVILTNSSPDAQAAGFYAAAYSVSSGPLSGKTVISSFWDSTSNWRRIRVSGQVPLLSRFAPFLAVFAIHFDKLCHFVIFFWYEGGSDLGDDECISS